MFGGLLWVQMATEREGQEMSLTVAKYTCSKCKAENRYRFPSSFKPFRRWHTHCRTGCRRYGLHRLVALEIKNRPVRLTKWGPHVR